jgi:hypothetical protein
MVAKHARVSTIWINHGNKRFYSSNAIVSQWPGRYNVAGASRDDCNGSGYFVNVVSSQTLKSGDAGIHFLRTDVRRSRFENFAVQLQNQET